MSKKKPSQGEGQDKPGVPEDRQGPLHTAIANELISLTPEWWNAALLKVGVEYHDDVLSMPHEIASLEGHREPITPSDTLFQLTHQLLMLFQEFNQPWKQVTYEVRLL